jgi:hypothetical protein
MKNELASARGDKNGMNTKSFLCSAYFTRTYYEININKNLLVKERKRNFYEGLYK